MPISIRPLSAVFSGGETSPLLESRVDQPRYQQGCKKLENFVCLAQGPATRRPGMMLVGPTDDQDLDNPVILIPFIFNTKEHRVIEMGLGYFVVWKDDVSIFESTHTLTALELLSIRYHQANDVIFIATGYRRPCKLTRVADNNWVIATINFMPTTEVPAAPTLTPHISLVTTAKRAYRYRITAVHATTGQESLRSPAATATTSLLSDIEGNYITLTWPAIAVQPLEYRIYKYAAGTFGYIGSVPGEAARTFDDTNIDADEEDAPPSAVDPFLNAGQYPSVVFGWQQRLGWAATASRPFTAWLSPSADFESMAASIPPADNDAITATLATSKADRIQWVAPDTSLIVGTAGDEWVFGPTNGDPLKPGSGFSRQGGRGSAPIKPMLSGGSLLFVQRGGRVIREVNYSFTKDKYEAVDLSILATHLFDEREVVDWCAQQNPYSIIWVIMNDGSLLGLTHEVEHEVVGWHQHSTDGVVTSICAVPAGAEDQVYMVVIRDIDGVPTRFIEKFAPFGVRYSSPKDSWHLDCAVHRLVGTATNYFAAMAPHLAGMEVSIWAEGREHAPQLVPTGGDITLDYEASDVLVGLPFDSTLRPNRPEVNTADGTSVGKVMKVTDVAIRFYRSMGGWAGATEDELSEIIMHDAADPLEPQQLSGIANVTVDTGWEQEWGFCIKAKGPAPMTVASVTYDAEIEG